MGFQTLFEPSSGAAAFDAAKRPSHPLRQLTKRPRKGPFIFQNQESRPELLPEEPIPV
jgi:hypothetical protein